MTTARRTLALAAAASMAVLALASAAFAQELRWPTPALPKDARLESPGESMAVNGMPLKIYRYHTAAKPEVLAHAFGATVTGKVVQGPPVPGDPRTTLAGRSGDFWLTLQIGSSGPGRTTATWSAAPRFVDGAQRKITLPPGFPSEAELYQHVDSYDADRRSQMAIGMMRAPIDAVAANLQQRLRELGFVKQPFPARNWTDAGDYAAVFHKAREELVVSLRPEGGGTALVINRISALDRLQ
jgi:hypothetical protein